MNRLAAAVVPGADGLRFHPLFFGTRSDPGARGSLTGIRADNLSPGHLARALLEGLAEELYRLYTSMGGDIGRRSLLVGAGNAIVRNPLLARILAQRFGRPLHVPAGEGAAAQGAAMMAAVSTGEFATLEGASGTLRDDHVVSPD